MLEGFPGGSDGKEPTCRAGVQIRSVAQLCPTLCDPMNRSTPGLPVHHQLLEFAQTHVHRVSDAIQPSHPLSSPSPPAPNPSQHQSLFQWVNSSHQVAKVTRVQSLDWVDPLERRMTTYLYFCLENSMDRGAWCATVHGVAKSQTWLSTHTQNVGPLVGKKCFITCQGHHSAAVETSCHLTFIFQII